MNIEAILEALDAGLDIEQISMLERPDRRSARSGHHRRARAVPGRDPGAADGTAMTTTELLRLRDRRGGHRLIVKDADADGVVRLSVAAGDTVSMGATLSMADLECLIQALTEVADRHR